MATVGLLRAGAAATLVLAGVILLCSGQWRWSAAGGLQRQQGWVTLENDFSTADRGLNWNLDAPTKADGSEKSWYAAGTGGGGGSLGQIMASDGGGMDGDAPQATDGNRASWASAATYDPEGLQQGGEAAQLAQLKKTLEVHLAPAPVHSANRTRN